MQELILAGMTEEVRAGWMSVPILLEPSRPEHAGSMFAGLSDPVGDRLLPDDPPGTVQLFQAWWARQVAERSADGREIRLNRNIRRDGTVDTPG